MTDRIRPPSKPGLIAGLLFRAFKARLGSVPFPSEVKAHRTAFLVGDVIVSSALMGNRAAPEKLKTLASLRAATLVGCVF
jgi:hypothetical protein